MKNILLCLFSLTMLLTPSAFAAEAVATVDSNRVSLGEAVNYTITVETSDSATVNSPRLPSLEGFEIVGRNESIESRSTIINGTFAFVQKKNFLFVLSPTKQGRLTIGSAEVVVGGKALKTQPISIDVGPPGSGGGAQGGAGGAGGGNRGRKAQPRQQQNPLEDDPFFQGDDDDPFTMLLKQRGMLPNQGGIRTQPINENEAFFIQLEVDKNTAYEGEQITASYYLVTQYNIRDIDTLKYPSLKGFWKEDIEIATRLNFQREIINGVAYNKALLASYALFPLKAGKTVIDPYKAKCTVVTQGAMLGFGRPYTFTKASQPVTIEVKPLPKDKQPTDYAGAVGEFKVSSKIEAAGGRVPVNQPFSLKVRVEGRGNAKVIEIPPLQLPQDLELYDQKQDSKFFRDGTSYKEFELFLIPRRQGKFTVPGIQMSTFEPHTGQYLQSKTDPIDITVGEGRGGNENYQSSPLALDEKKAKESKRGKELPAPVLEMDSPFTPNPKLMALAWIALYIVIFAVLGIKLRKEMGWGAREKSIREKASARLKILNKSVANNDYRKAGAEAVNLTNLVLGALTEDGSSDLSFDKLIMKTPPSVRREVEKDLAAVVEYFHSLAFAPEGFASQLAPNMKEKTRDLEKLLYKAIDVSQVGKSK